MKNKEIVIKRHKNAFCFKIDKGIYGILLDNSFGKDIRRVKIWGETPSAAWKNAKNIVREK